MKKNILTLAVTMTFVVSLLSGCGKTVEQVDSGNVIIESETAETEKPTEEEESNTEKPETEELVEEPELEPVPWLEEHGISIIPQGDFQISLWSYKTEADGNKVDAGDFTAYGNIVISETTEGVKEGFKKVIACLTLDVSNRNGGCNYWFGAFDRYSGIYIKMANGYLSVNPNEQAYKDETITIQYGDDTFDVSVEDSVDFQDPIGIETLTVICPIDYDGTVFGIGYATQELIDQDNQLNYSERQYTLDEIPFYADSNLYFTITNN